MSIGPTHHDYWSCDKCDYVSTFYVGTDPVAYYYSAKIKSSLLSSRIPNIMSTPSWCPVMKSKKEDGV